MRSALILALLSIFMARPVGARTLDHFVKACGMAGTPSSVVVDVYSDLSPGSVLATIPNSEVTQIGTTSCFQANLATTAAAIGYPDASDPAEKHYTVVFRDDLLTEIYLTETVSGLAGSEAYQMCARETPIYPTAPVPSRGITIQTIAQGKPSYFKVEIDCSGSFAAPPVVFYWTFDYDVDGRVSKKTPSASPPSP